MRHFITLVGDHIALINDIYSFDKESYEFQSAGATFTNTVHYLDEILSIGPQMAKTVAFQLTIDWEVKLEEELKRMKVSDQFNKTQLRYAHGLLETVAGNVLYSVTSARYARYSATQSIK